MTSRRRIDMSNALTPLGAPTLEPAWLKHDPAVVYDPASQEAQSDQFRPPTQPVDASCRHCGVSFRSDAMIWGAKEGCRSVGPIWWCPTPLCDGGGFGFDIFPTKKGIKP